MRITTSNRGKLGRRLGVSLAFGAVVNLVMAYVGVRLSQSPFVNAPGGLDLSVLFQAARQASGSFGSPVPSGWPLKNNEDDAVEVERDPCYALTKHTRQAPPTHPWRSNGYFVSTISDFGWPFHSMWFVDVDPFIEGWPECPWNRKLVLSKTVAATLKVDGLPLGVHPVLFAANTMVYGIGIFAMLTGVSALQAAERRRRGLCPECLYPVGESPVCTECGAGVRGP